MQGTDYPKLGSAYLSCACVLRSGAAYARTISPINIDLTMNGTRVDNKRISFAQSLPVLTQTLKFVVFCLKPDCSAGSREEKKTSIVFWKFISN